MLRPDVLEDPVVIALADGRLLGDIRSVHRFAGFHEIADFALECEEMVSSVPAVCRIKIASEDNRLIVLSSANGLL